MLNNFPFFSNLWDDLCILIHFIFCVHTCVYIIINYYLYVNGAKIIFSLNIKCFRYDKYIGVANETELADFGLSKLKKWPADQLSINMSAVWTALGSNVCFQFSKFNTS